MNWQDRRVGLRQKKGPAVGRSLSSLGTTGLLVGIVLTALLARLVVLAALLSALPGFLRLLLAGLLILLPALLAALAALLVLLAWQTRYWNMRAPTTKRSLPRSRVRRALQDRPLQCPNCSETEHKPATVRPCRLD